VFTGIVTDVGRVVAVERGRAAKRFAIESGYDAATIDVGASIAHAGCCLTVIEREAAKAGARHVVEASTETLARTTLDRWTVGTRVNLERPLKVGDELGGHFVAGHVDGVGVVLVREQRQGSARLTFEAPNAIAPFVAEKGSLALDGVSMTVNAVEGALFEINVIPHTLEATTLSALTPGDAVNLEVDLLARYLARLAETGRASDGG
jgi:riboflavin synthase